MSLLCLFYISSIPLPHENARTHASPSDTDTNGRFRPEAISVVLGVNRLLDVVPVPAPDVVPGVAHGESRVLDVGRAPGDIDRTENQDCTVAVAAVVVLDDTNTRPHIAAAVAVAADTDYRDFHSNHRQSPPKSDRYGTEVPPARPPGRSTSPTSTQLPPKHTSLSTKCHA